MVELLVKRDLAKVIVIFDSSKALLVVRVKPNVNFNSDDSISLLKSIEELVGHTPHKAMVDLGKFTSSSEQSRKLYKESEYINLYRKADAFIVRGMFTRLLINTFLSITKPTIPTKSFSNEKDALLWLDSIEI